jgi:CrcB protein
MKGENFGKGCERNMRLYFAVLIGGALGAGLRSLLSSVFGAVEPWVTMGINVVGCLALGFLVTQEWIKQRWSEAVRIGLGTGVLGGFTTFSTYSLQGIRMLQGGHAFAAILYLLGSLALGLLAAWLGMWAARKAGV